MVKPNRKQILKSIETDGLRPVYFFHGDDSRTMDKAQKIVEDRVLDGGLPEFNAEYFNARETEASVVTSSCQTMPVMADKRLVVLRHLQEWKDPQKKSLSQYLESPNPETVLVIVNIGLLKGPAAGKEDKALMKIAKKSGAVIDFPRPYKRDVPAIIQDIAEDEGKKFEGPALTLLAELAGDETLGIEQEVLKVVLYTGDRKKITRDDVLKAVADIKEATVFEFTDSIGIRDVEGSLRTYRKMREKGQEPLMVLGMLLRHFRMIWKIQKLREEGQTPGAVAKKLRMNEWILKNNYLPQIKKFPDFEFGRITRVLSELDIKMKSTRSDREVLFERTIMKLCSGRF
jgi:DNA polymerase III subunit delta